MKRFTDTSKWTQNKWFRKLSIENKLFWMYVCDMCDGVGVWEEDIDLAGILIGYTYSMDSLLEVFNNKIKIFRDGKKWWIKDFCNFQYGDLQDDSKNKPHTSYIKLLKKHSLYKDYRKGIHTFKEKEKDEDKVKDKDKELEKENKKYITAPKDLEMVLEYFKEKGHPKSEAITFWNYFESIGWIVGKKRTPMKKWRNAVGNWMKDKKGKTSTGFDITSVEKIMDEKEIILDRIEQQKDLIKSMDKDDPDLELENKNLADMEEQARLIL